MTYFHFSIYVKFLKNKFKSTPYVGNKYRASDFLKRQRSKESKFLLDLENETTGKVSSGLQIRNEIANVLIMYFWSH